LLLDQFSYGKFLQDAIQVKRTSIQLVFLNHNNIDITFIVESIVRERTKQTYFLKSKVSVQGWFQIF